MLLLKQNTTRKRQVDENATELNVSNNEGGEYEVKAIYDSAVYARESTGHLSGLYYLVSGKSYLIEENTWEPYSAIQHLRKLISSFYKNHPNKPITTFDAIDTAPLIVWPTIKLAAKSTVRPISKTKARLTIRQEH